MDDLKKYKYEIEKEIVERAITEFEKGKVEEKDLKEIAEFTIEGMKNVNSRQDGLNFLNQLSSKWTFFKSIAITEEGEYKEMVDNEIYSGVLTLAQNGKIDRAINLAKSATN